MRCHGTVDHGRPRVGQLHDSESRRAGERNRPFAAHDNPLPEAANNSATNGASLMANYNVPNVVVASLLGRLPSGSNANGTTTVNLVEPAQVAPESA